MLRKSIAILIAVCAAAKAATVCYEGYFDRDGLFMTFDPLNGMHSAITPLVDSEIQQIIDQKAKEERNMEIVRKFYQELFGDKDFTAIDRYISPVTYIQHNPHVADGADALREAMSFLKGQPKEVLDVKHIGAHGDFVYYHLKDTKMEPGEVFSVMDIFRLDDGLIVEHWDVMQKVPKESRNPHPMF